MWFILIFACVGRCGNAFTFVSIRTGGCLDIVFPTRNKWLYKDKPPTNGESCNKPDNAVVENTYEYFICEQLSSLVHNAPETKFPFLNLYSQVRCVMARKLLLDRQTSTYLGLTFRYCCIGSTLPIYGLHHPKTVTTIRSCDVLNISFWM